MKKIGWLTTSAAVALTLLCGFGVRAADVAGSRYEGSEIVGSEVSEYDGANLVEGPFAPTSTNGGTGFKTVEGRISSLAPPTSDSRRQALVRC